MKRTHLITLAIAILAVAPASGCSLAPDFELEGLECLFGETATNLTSIFARPHLGDGGEAELFGLCSVFEDCQGERPIAVGEAVDVRVVATSPTEDPADGVLSTSSSTVVVVSVYDDGCGNSYATLAAKTAGSGALIFNRGSQTVDTFAIETAEADSIRIAALHHDQGGAVVLSPGQDDLVRLEVRDHEDRTLAIGASVTWSIDDESVVAFASEPGRSALQPIVASSPGITVVRARFRDVEVSIPVTIE